ncbi:MAG: FoF1 ATP synthase subunit a, partial [Candidatus Babeliales bacterium]
MSIELFQYKTITPLASLGLTGKFWNVHIDTLIATWVAMVMLIGFIAVGRLFLKKRPKGVVAFGYQKIVLAFMDFYKDTFHNFNYNFFLFIVSLFFFTFFCCLVGILPFLHEEATGDLNTTIAISLTSFLYIQYQKIAAHGIGGYLHEFIDPIFVLAPIHLVGELSKIASMAFRLFGNILGGSIIFKLIMELVHTYQVPFTTYLLCVLVGTVLFSYTSFYQKIGWLRNISNGLTLT